MVTNTSLCSTIVDSRPTPFFIFLLIVNNIDISIYANDRAFITEDKIENVTILSDWFKSNRLKRNPDNWPVLVIIHKYLDIKTGNYAIGSSKYKKLFGVKIISI